MKLFRLISGGIYILFLSFLAVHLEIWQKGWRFLGFGLLALVLFWGLGWWVVDKMTIWLSIPKFWVNQCCLKDPELRQALEKVERRKGRIYVAEVIAAIKEVDEYF